MGHAELKNSFLGQATLEICLAIVIGILLLMGAISVWNYFSKVKVERMDDYKGTRLAALELRSWGDTGKQVDYEPPPLDIFSMAATVGEAPNPEGVEPYPQYPQGSCDAEFNDLAELSGPLVEDIGELSEDFANLMSDSIDQRQELGMLKVWYWIGGITVIGPLLPLPFELYDYIMTWLYDDEEDFFLNNWDTIGADFDNKIYNSLGQFEVAFFDGLLMGGIPFGWLLGVVTAVNFKDEETGTFYTGNGVWNNFITPGNIIENQMEAVNLETLIKQGLLPLIIKVAEAKFNACIRELEGGDTTCDDLCGGNLEQAETEINESIEEANNGQLPESNASYLEVINQLDQYETCFVDCSGESPWYTNPCLADCQDEFDAYLDKAIEVQTAAAEGRIGDSQALFEEAQNLYEDYEDCLDGCN